MEWNDDMSAAPNENEGVGSVIVYAVRWGMGIVGEAYLKEDGEWWWENTSDGDYHAESLAASGFQVTHWMPLPAPPVNEE